LVVAIGVVGPLGSVVVAVVVVAVPKGVAAFVVVVVGITALLRGRTLSKKRLSLIVLGVIEGALLIAKTTSCFDCLGRIGLLN
jgi:hypothetical protein